MTKIILDSALGGYPCWGCGLPFGPDQPQIILGMEDEICAVCLACLASGEVELWGNGHHYCKESGA